MGITTPRVAISDTIIASPQSAAETIVAQIDGIATRPGGSIVALLASLTITIGTSGTNLNLRVRRGTTLTSPLVGGTGSQTATAGNTRTHSLLVSDTPGEVAGQSYVLTAQVTAATTASGVLAVGLQATY